MAAKATRRPVAPVDDKEAINTVEKSKPTRGVTTIVSDENGRQIEVKLLGALDNMRLARAAGKDAQNSSFMLYATIAASVVSIDGERIPQPQSIREIEFIIQRLDNAGVIAVADGLKELAGVKDVQSAQDELETARNLP